MSRLSRILCLVGLHGPILRSAIASGPRNHSISPGVRGCANCGAKWVADAEDMGSKWRMFWVRS